MKGFIYLSNFTSKHLKMLFQTNPRLMTILGSLLNLHVPEQADLAL